jgi:transcriptional regulator with XRE-family HTH domain
MSQLTGKRIRDLREAHGLSQKELAARAGVDRIYLCRIEKGRRPGVHAVTIVQLAAVLETSTDYLLGLTDDPASPLPAGRWADPARLAGLERLVERIARLPRERQERVTGAVLALLEGGGISI